MGRRLDSEWGGCWVVGSLRWLDAEEGVVSERDVDAERGVGR